VFAKLRDWFDDRTGYRKLRDALLLEHIPGGARWRYVWGSCLAAVFGVQLVTGVLLMTAYSPGDSTAWSSVYFIQYEMDFGWLIRGLHHFGSQTMVVLLGVHMLQVVIAGAHLPPREVNWWLGLLLMACVLGLSLTGYLLPWDQKGYWATQVATNIAGNLPGAGSLVQKIAVGGPAYGHHTLTRFYALHTAVLAPLVIVLLVAHVAVFRRHGVTHSKNPVGEGLFWPNQAFRDLLVSLLVFGVMLGLVIYGHGQKLETADGAGLYERIAHAGRDGCGANLDAPADPSRPYPARPEWYFLFLFQLLKYFEGEQELIGTVVIPNAVLLSLFALPLLGYGRMRPVGHVVGVLVVVALLAGVGFLSYQAVAADRDPYPALQTASELQRLTPAKREHVEKARKFRQELAEADELAHRAVQLAHEGVPPEGAVYLLRRDPLTQGPRLFKQHCAVCHPYGDEFSVDAAASPPTASDLKGFGTPEWIRGLLREPESPRFFGRTKLTAMSNWVKRTRTNERRKGKENELDAEFDRIAAWLGGHPDQDVPADADESPFAQGYGAFAARCGSCHLYKGEGGGGSSRGPDLTGYGGTDWLRLMLTAPASVARYGINNAMPAFQDLEGPEAEINRLELRQQADLLSQTIRDDSPQAEEKRQRVETACRAVSLSAVDRELIIRWLTRDYRVVFGGEPVSGAPRPAERSGATANPSD
jgi:ubiquinol-cytochrome c reductase cytochrome b subunit